jgi:hypothetical protein
MIHVHEKTGGKTGEAATAVKEFYVMRKRGNDEVAPPKDLLEWYLDKKKLWANQWDVDVNGGKVINWPEYRKRYLQHLETDEAKEWMKRVTEISKETEVILICYEKDWHYCHRTLLAKTMAEKFGADYRGEIQPHGKLGCTVIK